MAITPRHYLDFINHYANLFHEKRSELEEQQMHLNVGLRKIKETVDQVLASPHSHITRCAAVRASEWLSTVLTPWRGLCVSGRRAAS